MIRIHLFLLVIGVWGVGSVSAQSTSGEWAWRPLFHHEGVEFYYLFYSEADNENNGVVIKLVNTNDFSVIYHFDVVFKAGASSHVETVDGKLEAGEIKTGGSAGLFWVPFKDGRTIGELGLRGYKITRAKAKGA